MVKLRALCLVPHWSKANREAALDPAFERETTRLTYTLKNGNRDGRASFEATIEATLRRYESAIKQTLAKVERPVFIPIPRSGDSKIAFDHLADPYPVRTLALWLAGLDSGWRSVDAITRTTPVSRGSHDVLLHVKSTSLDTTLNLEGHTIILVDDVVTQGASMMACRQHFAADSRVFGLAVAYTLAPRDAAIARRGPLMVEIQWDGKGSRASSALVPPAAPSKP